MLVELCLYLSLSTTPITDAVIDIEHVYYEIHAATYSQDVGRLCSPWNHKIYWDAQELHEMIQGAIVDAD